ncbi:MAG: penicillin-binding protein activator [Gammaproteobacteria bacterium]|nr:penicillin-binding protein activator [Gammaproteobacteria bacterium]MCY4166562.1 penicillin-binding protein activator [Gammaproteobacteria bacterium]MCY4341470.1 penicillin-binding protein activator [Gammaproteobacteria bacterium]
MIASLAILALAGCAAGDRLGASGEAGALAAREQQALELSRSGDHDDARQVYLSMARRSANAERARYRILAAREAGLDGRHQRALDELLAIEPPPRWLGLWSLAAAGSERVLEGAQAAYERLANIEPENFPNLAGDLARTRSELLFALQRPAEALGELTRLGADFSEGHESTAEFTWSLLREHRSQLSTEGVTGAPLGWIELALLADQLAGDPTEAGAALNGWRRNFPDHPAGSLLESAVRPEICSGLKPLGRLAMLLPGSQPYRAALKSLRDGFLAARYALMSSCEAPEIAFYEVGDSSHAARQWTRAAAEGADFIVGPLLPESVENAARVAGGLPTLALNRLRGQAPPANFEEFALAPEHEARQAARQALGRGLLRALALYPRDAWGQRIYRSFLEEYQAGGGRLIAREQYSLSAVDYSEPIGRLLKISASNRRARELGAKLGRNLSFQPRRRQDADLIFLVARAAQGQLLVPQLRYNYSGDLPVFAIQSTFDPDHADNRDLDGVEMPALPALTHQHVQLSHGQLSAAALAGADFNVSLFAMGYDSFKLALALYGGSEALKGGIRGLTGTIFRTSGGSLERKLAWTQIENGKLTTTEN